MRIIGGEHGRRRISPPANMPHTRPTTDLAKEGLFNVISYNHFSAYVQAQTILWSSTNVFQK